MEYVIIIMWLYNCIVIKFLTGYNSLAQPIQCSLIPVCLKLTPQNRNKQGRQIKKIRTLGPTTWAYQSFNCSVFFLFLPLCI